MLRSECDRLLASCLHAAQVIKAAALMYSHAEDVLAFRLVMHFGAQAAHLRAGIARLHAVIEFYRAAAGYAAAVDASWEIDAARECSPLQVRAYLEAVFCSALRSWAALSSALHSDHDYRMNAHRRHLRSHKCTLLRLRVCHSMP